MREIPITIKKRLPLIKSQYVTIQIAKDKGILSWKDQGESFKVAFDSNEGDKIKVTVKTEDLTNSFTEFKSRRDNVQIEVKNDIVVLYQKDVVSKIETQKEESVSRVLSGDTLTTIDDLSPLRDFLGIVLKKSGNKALSHSNDVLLSKQGFYRINESELFVYTLNVETEKVFALDKTQVKTLSDILKACPSNTILVVTDGQNIMFKTDDFEYQTSIVEAKNLIPLDFSVLLKDLRWKRLGEIEKDTIYHKLKEKNGDYYTSILNKDNTVYAKDLGNLIYSLTGDIDLSEDDKAVYLRNTDIIRIQTKRKLS